MPDVMNVAIKDRGTEPPGSRDTLRTQLYQAIQAMGDDDQTTEKATQEINARYPDIYRHLTEAFAPNSVQSALLNVRIGGKTLESICTEKDPARFASCTDRQKLLIGCMELYSAMKDRDKSIEYEVPNPEVPGQTNTLYIRPEIKKGSNIFSRLWNSIKEVFGAAGTNKDVLRGYDKLIEAREEQRERDEIQRDLLDAEVASERVIDADYDAFFGKDNLQPYLDRITDTTDKRACRDIFHIAMARASDRLELGNLNNRMPTNLNFARMFMIAEGHDMETIMSQSPEAMELKRQAGGRIASLLFGPGTDEEKKQRLTEIAIAGATYLSEREHYPEFDITSDRAITDIAADPVYGVYATLLKDFEQTFMSDRKPYMDRVKAAIPQTVFDDYRKYAGNYQTVWAYSCRSRKDVILSDAYSMAYLGAPPEQHERVQKVTDGLCEDGTSFTGKAYGHLDIAHHLREGHGNSIIDMDGTYAYYMSQMYAKTSVANAFPRINNAAWLEKAEKQVLRGTRPDVPEPIVQMRNEREEEHRTLEQRAAEPVVRAPKTDVSATFTATKEPKQTTTTQPQKDSKPVEKKR